jgi:hypothetical protein
MLITTVSKVKTRVMGAMVWSEENGHVCQVDDLDLLKEMFTHPAYDGDFAVSPDDPLGQLVGDDYPVRMLVVYGGITAVEQLASLTKEDAARLASSLVVTQRTLSDWVKAAQKLVKQAADEETAVAQEIVLED